MTTPTWPVDWWRPLPDGGIGASTTGARDTIEPGGAVSFGALVAFTVVMLLAPQEMFPVLAPLRIALVAAACAAAAHVLHRRSQRQPAVTLGPQMRTCLALVAWAVVMIPFAEWPGGAMGLLLGLYLKSVIVFWLLGEIIRTTERLRQLAWVLSLIAVPIALTGLAHFSSGTFSQAGAASSRIVGYDAGLARNPNDLALLLNLILPLTVMLLVSAETTHRRLVLAAIVAATICGIVATFSRSGFVTLATSAVLLAWHLRRRPGAGWLWAVMAAAVVAAPLLPSAYLERIGSIADKDSDPTGSAQTRWSDSAAAVAYVADHPVIGAGLGGDILVLNERRGATWTQVHNAYLEYAVDLGLPGLGLFVLLLWRCLAAVRAVRARCLARGDASVLLALSEGVWISLVAFAVAALFHPVAYHVYFYYVAGLAMAVSATSDRERA